MNTIIIDGTIAIVSLALGFVGGFIVNKYEPKAAATIQAGVDTTTATVETAVNDVAK
ncbi:hypothetical protein [Gluconobacter albidus]|uniref:Uncharacterized protein n=1 Tax=Gluconobacter albidus TaxID=318683 RepID=A0ABQ5X3M5_9PROT|nr:hypothetical protein [Gluconobacter albidus]GBQ89570.1 hypothetical protein AA3250_1845 [Gluconobacter albidus NBRC 3250]GLQ69500.1 hypothetical protein GCM10007866_19520 [Gluconobacter albidus]